MGDKHSLEDIDERLVVHKSEVVRVVVEEHRDLRIKHSAGVRVRIEILCDDIVLVSSWTWQNSRLAHL